MPHRIPYSAKSVAQQIERRGVWGVGGMHNSAHCRAGLGSIGNLLRNIFRLLALIIGWDRCALG